MTLLRPCPRSLAIASLGAAACAGGAPKEDPEAKLRAAYLLNVEREACLKPSTSFTCEPGWRVSYDAPRHDSLAITDGPILTRKTATLWCEAGTPRGRFTSFDKANEELERDVPPPVWDAIWRVIDATDACASAFGVAVKVMKNGATRTCAAPRFDLGDLFGIAFRTARQGPSARTRVQRSPPVEDDSGLEGICAIDPSACPAPSPGPCAPFQGPLWPPAAERVTAGSSIDRAGPDDPDPEDPSTPDGARLEAGSMPVKPSQGAVTGALSAVLPEARACTAPGDPVARATITFRPDGAVETVTVGGGATGKASHACIERVFRKARVPPFDGEPSHTASVTIRGRE